MFRRWLRSWIGWDEGLASHRDSVVHGQEIQSLREDILVLTERIEAHETRLCRLQRRADTAPVRASDLDWEAQQQAFLNNPENFKEVN